MEIISYSFFGRLNTKIFPIIPNTITHHVITCNGLKYLSCQFFQSGKIFQISISPIVYNYKNTVIYHSSESNQLSHNKLPVARHIYDQLSSFLFKLLQTSDGREL